jgi:glycosyltransferase involved in cell wall biosynthesis
MTARPPHPLVSIVIPCHDEELTLEPLLAAFDRALDTAAADYEMILVDDGSRDGTWALIERLAAARPSVRGLHLSRNFGHQSALLAGFTASRGDCVVTIDADLQHPPEVVPELINRWRDGFNVVRTTRADAATTSFFKRRTSHLFYRLFSRLSGVNLFDGSSDFRLLDRMVVNEILSLNEGEYFLRGLVAWMGFRTTVVSFQAAPRFAGRTKYSLSRMLRFATSAIISFSITPLRVGIGVGLLTAAVAFAELLYVVVQEVRGHTVPGWASTVAITTLLLGVQFVLTGLLGEYLGRVHLAAKRRPSFIIEERTGAPATSRSRPAAGDRAQ